MNEQASSLLLQDQGVLVTRPGHQANHFISELYALGARPIGFPSIEILPISQSSLLDKALNDFDSYHIIIFISSNAVENGLKWLDNSSKSLKSKKIAAIGESTKKALEQHGLKIQLSPLQHFTSEALLDLDGFSANKINQQNILIIKGEGGRELLQHTLESRGAQVALAEVYQRRIPETDIQPLLKLWAEKRIQWVTVTSNESLKNLYYMLNEQGQDWLRQTPLVVPGQRCQQLALQLGFNNQILLAQSATDDAMLNAIKQNAYKH